MSTLGEDPGSSDLRRELEQKMRLREEIEQKISQLRKELKEREAAAAVLCADVSQVSGADACSQTDMSALRYKRSGHNNMGGLYESKMCSLLFTRALISNNSFHIANNLEAAHPFDDVVLRLGNTSVFLQLKHSQNARPINNQKLVFPSSDISLLKYCKHWLQMKRKWPTEKDLSYYGKFEDVKFILFTNSEMDQIPRNQNRNKDDIISELENIVKTKGSIFRISRNTHGVVYEAFEKLEKYKQILRDEARSEDDIVLVVRDLVNMKANHTNLPLEKDLSKLLKELEELGDLSGYEEFLSQLYFCTGQVPESGLDNLIKSELEILCGDSAVFVELQAGIDAWWKSSRRFLTEKTAVWQDIVQKCVSKLCRAPDLGLEFTEEALGEIKTQLTSGSNLHQVVSDCITLSCHKVRQSLEVQFVTDIFTLREQHDAMFRLWNRCHLLVILEDAPGDRVGENLVSQLRNTLLMSVQNRLIIISRGESALSKQLTNIGLVPEVHQDVFRMSQLNPESQARIYDCLITFQAKPLPLSALSPKAALQEVVTGDIVVEMLSTGLSVGGSLLEEDTCYIARTLVRREHVRHEAFSASEMSDHILAVSGTTVRKLKKLLSHEEVEHFRSDAQTSCRCVVINESKDFWQLSNEHQNKTVHWLRKHEDKYIWKRSKGDVTQLVNYLADTETTYDDYSKILDLSHKVVLIVAEPGMGKSTELSHMARKLKDLDPEMWLIRVDLNDYSDFLVQDNPDAIELLLRAGKFDNKFQRALLEHHVYNTGNVVVLMDGFDEISPEYSEKVLVMLKTLAATRISHICVTSRPVMRPRLEQELSTISFSFKPFTEKDQKEFLLRFWKIPQGSCFALSDFIDELLRLTAKSMNDKMKEFTGIPLQTKMLAEIFQAAAEQYGESGNINLPPKLDLLELYENFIDQKWKVFCNKKKEDITNVGVCDDNEVLREDFREKHKICGLVALLTNRELESLHDSAKIKSEYSKFVDRFQTGRIKAGIIVNVVNGVPMFVHRTFAEFFAALWFSENYTSCRKYIERNFLKRGNVTRMFFDRILAQRHKLHTAVLNQDSEEAQAVLRNVNERDDGGRTTLHLAVLNQDSKEAQAVLRNVNERDDGGRTALHLAVLNHLDDFEENPDTVKQVTSLLLERQADPEKRDSVLQMSPVRLADKTGAWSALEMILEKHKVKKLPVIEDRIKQEEYLHTMLRVSAQRGFMNLIAHLLKCELEVDRLIPVGKAKMTMLHIAAWSNQLNLVKFLVEHDADVDAKDEYNRTPLIAAASGGNIQIVEYFLDKKIDLNAQDNFKRTAIWSAGSRGHTEVVLLLEDRGADVDVSDRGTGNNLLHLAVKSSNVELIGKLKNKAVIINKKNKQSETPLLLSAKTGSWGAFRALWVLGAKSGISDKHGNNVLHFLAQLGHLFDIIEPYRIVPFIQTANSKGQTPLLFAAKHKGRLPMMRTLRRLGASVTQRDNEGNTGLHYAANCDDVEAIQWFVQEGLDVNSRNHRGQTPLWCAVNSGRLQAADALLELEADATLPDHALRSPVHMAIVNKHLPMQEKLLSHRVSMNDTASDIIQTRGFDFLDSMYSWNGF